MATKTRKLRTRLLNVGFAVIKDEYALRIWNSTPFRVEMKIIPTDPNPFPEERFPGYDPRGGTRPLFPGDIEDIPFSRHESGMAFKVVAQLYLGNSQIFAHLRDKGVSELIVKGFEAAFNSGLQIIEIELGTEKATSAAWMV